MWFAMANNGTSISWESEFPLLNLMYSHREKRHWSWSLECAAYNSKDWAQGNVQSERVPVPQPVAEGPPLTPARSSGLPSQESSSSGFGLCSWCRTNSSSGTGTTALKMDFAVCRNSKSGSLGQMDWLRGKCFCSPALEEALGDLVLEGFLDVGPLCYLQLMPEGEVFSFLGFTLQDIFFLQTAHCLQVRRQTLKMRGEN